MFKKRDKLPIQDFFNKKGESQKTPFFLLKKFPKEKETGRIGVIVSKKISKNAVIRNRTRRRVLAAMRGSDMLQKKDILCITLPGAEKLSSEEIKKELTI